MNPFVNSVFISYRRSDSSDVVAPLYDQMVAALGKGVVFRDVDAIPIGSNFPSVISKALVSCRVVLIIIGPDWLRVTEEDGTRRIDNPKDHVRLEIEHALSQKKLKLIPVLIKGAQMPDAHELPDSLKEICSINAAILRPDAHFDGDVTKLTKSVKATAHLRLRKIARLARIFGLTAVVLALCFTWWYRSYLAPLIARADTYELSDLRKLEVATTVYDRYGVPLSRIAAANRDITKIEQLPVHLIDALMSSQDPDFYVHPGFSTSCLLDHLFSHSARYSLTQTLASLTFPADPSEQDLVDRWWLDAMIARRIEREFSKYEILELLLNRCSFGQGIYGIEAAASGYFGKRVSDLSIEEGAVLCAIFADPKRLNPWTDPQAVIAARNKIFESMVQSDYLTLEEAERLRGKPLITTQQNAVADRSNSYASDEVRRQVATAIGSDKALVGGYSVYSTIDMDIQAAAEKAIQRRLKDYESSTGYAHRTYDQHKSVVLDYEKELESPRGGQQSKPKPRPQYLQAAAIVINNGTGEVLSLVGGRDYTHDKGVVYYLNEADDTPVIGPINRATTYSRPLGSAFGPFVSAAYYMRRKDASIPARGSALPPSHPLSSISNKLNSWGAELLPPQFPDSISAFDASAMGCTTALLTVAEDAGIESISETARKAGFDLGIEPQRSPDLSNASNLDLIALGSSRTSLMNACTAFASIANGGILVKPVLVARICEASGNVIYSCPDPPSDQPALMSKSCADQLRRSQEAFMTSKSCVLLRVASALRPDIQCFGKPGSSYNFEDAWFIGSSGEFTCAVWCGFDRAKTISESAFGSRIAFPIWADIMNSCVKAK